MIITEQGNLVFDYRNGDFPEHLTIDVLENYEPNYVFFPFWSWKIPKEIYDRWKCVIFHMTDVPFGRGGHPLENLLARNVKVTMISAIKCVEEWDAGDVYMKVAMDISNGQRHHIIWEVGYMIGKMIKFIEKYVDAAAPQRGEVVKFRRMQ